MSYEFYPSTQNSKLKTHNLLNVVGKLIPDPIDCEDVARVAGIGLELAAQILDVRVHGAVESGVVHVVRQLQELRASERAARLAGQDRQQVELGRGQLDRRSADAHAATLEVDRQVAGAQHRRGVALALGP